MKISSLVIGKGSGSAGNITVVQLKGQTILKQKAENVANPRTTLQIAQRKMINRAVYAWQLIGNLVKSGWTSLLPYCSQYQTYVSANSAFFKNATFDKSTFKNLDLSGSQASKGRLGTLSYTFDDITNSDVIIEFNKNNLNNILKVGDTIHILIGGNTKDVLSYGSHVVTQADLASAAPSVTFVVDPENLDQSNVLAVFAVSADGKESTTSVFETV